MPLTIALGSVNGCALVAYAVVSQLAGCAAPPRNAGAQSGRADAAPASESIHAENCAIGWMQVQKALCVRFLGLEQSDEPPVNLVAMELVSKTDYVHLGLRVAVFRGAGKWCAFPGVLSLYQIERTHQYRFRVPCSMSGTPLESGEFRLVVEVDEAIEMHSAQ